MAQGITDADVPLPMLRRRQRRCNQPRKAPEPVCAPAPAGSIRRKNVGVPPQPIDVHITSTISWWAVVLDGVVSAVVGGLISLVVALLVVRRTYASDRALVHERRAQEAAATLMAVFAQCGNGLLDHAHALDEQAEIDRDELVTLVNGTVVTELPAFTDARFDEILTTAAQAVAELVTLLYRELLNDALALYRPNERLIPQSEWALATASIGELSDYLANVIGVLGEFRRDPTHQPAAPTPPSFMALKARIAKTTPLGWRSEPNGALAAGAMNALQHTSSHPGYSYLPANDDSPYIVYAFWTPCQELGTDPPTSELEKSFRSLLDSTDVRRLVDQLSTKAPGRDWTSFGGHGRVMLEAALGDPSAPEVPASTALLSFASSPRIGGAYQHRAVLVIRVDRQELDGASCPPMKLSQLAAQLTTQVEAADAFRRYLADDLHILRDEVSVPAVQVGFMLNAARGLDEMLDLTGYHTRPGTTVSREWRGYLLQEPNGRAAAEAAVDAVTVLCDSGLHIQGYESDLTPPHS